MSEYKITKGLDLPISGRPLQVIRDAPKATRVAVMADDFPGMKPAMKIEEGETVKRGQLLFEDRKTPGVLHTAPGAGRVIGIHRGARRALQSIVIDLSDSEQAGSPDASELQNFDAYTGRPAAQQDRATLTKLLVESGLWTALRQRPFAKVPSPETQPASIFVTAMDTNPLAPLPDVVVEREPQAFSEGLRALAKLTEGKLYLCVDAASSIPTHAEAPVSVQRFSGPHPAGTPGLHIHLLEPVSRARTVWYVGYQDVIAIGRLLATGHLDFTRVISIAGPPVEDPRLVVTRMGACVEDVTGDLGGPGQELRLISGSVLSGKRAMGDIFGYMGRYDVQISVLEEDREKEFLGWLTPGWNSFSVIPIFVSRLLGRKKPFDLTTSTHGSHRAMVPLGLYEKVMPFDIMPTFLLRSMLVGDVQRAEELGILELAEEDVALCTFVCPGKIDYGPVLRRNLEIIEKEG